LALFYSRAKLLVYPSLYEGFGLPPLEAMACGCPVLTSERASLPEVCGDAAVYCDPESIESIEEGIYRILTDEQLRDTLIEKGLKRTKFFEWGNSAKKVLDIFREFGSCT
ncbi:MAG: glycosyltransferase family 1 protein, partial [Candidatus Aenigmatarchaeota archaeon]